jgi:DNA-binding FadR family transcriptional regulator
VRLVAFAAPEMVEYAAHAHASILERLAERDVDGAREAMRTHLEEAERVWSGASPSVALK